MPKSPVLAQMQHRKFTHPVLLLDLSGSELSSSSSGNLFCSSIVDSPVLRDFLCLKFGFMAALDLGLGVFVFSVKNYRI